MLALLSVDTEEGEYLKLQHAHSTVIQHTCSTGFWLLGIKSTKSHSMHFLLSPSRPFPT